MTEQELLLFDLRGCVGDPRHSIIAVVPLVSILTEAWIAPRFGRMASGS